LGWSHTNADEIAKMKIKSSRTVWESVRRDTTGCCLVTVRENQKRDFCQSARRLQTGRGPDNFKDQNAVVRKKGTKDPEIERSPGYQNHPN